MAESSESEAQLYLARIQGLAEAVRDGKTTNTEPARFRPVRRKRVTLKSPCGNSVARDLCAGVG